MLDVKNEYLYNLLERIKQRPGMYLGECAITRLNMLLVGYGQARMELGLPRTSQEQEFDNFQQWIETKYNIRSNQGWDKIILDNSADDKEAFYRFFELFEQFLNQNINVDEIEFAST